MTRFELVKWRELAVADREAWTAFRAADPGLRSPYFDLGWFDAVDRARGDLKVLRGTEAGRPVAFFAFHPGLLGSCRPAGGTFADWHGFVAEPGRVVDARAALSAGPATLRFEATPAGDAALAPFAEASAQSHLMDLSRGFDLYARPTEGAAPKAVANLRRAQRKLEADGLELRIVADDRDPATFAALMALKSAQYRRSGHADALAWAWSRRLVEGLHQGSDAGFGGLLSSLWLNGELAAAHFGLRSGAVLHHWLPAYEPRFAKYAPGNVLALEIARWSAGEGVTEIDLGPGDYPWKREFANAAAPMIRGVVHGDSTTGRFNAAAYRMGRRLAEAPLGSLAGLPHRVSRRIERELGGFAPRP